MALQDPVAAQPANRLASSAIVVGLLGAGLLVGGASMLIARHSGAWWAVPLPAIGAYALIVIGIYLRDSDNPIGRAIAVVLAAASRRAGLAVALAVAVTAAAATLGVYLWRTTPKSDGEMRFLVFTGANVDGRRAAGMRVLLEHIGRPDAPVDQVTNAKGVVGFPVNVGDTVTVRIVAAKGVYVIEPNKTVSADDLTRFQSVDLATLPDQGWLTTREAADLGESIGYLTTDPALLRWRDRRPSQLIGDPAATARLAPFGLPQAEIVIARSAFVIGFSPNLRQPRWVASEITNEPRTPRESSTWSKDPAVSPDIQADSDDYARNIFDRSDLVRRSDLPADVRDRPERTYMTMVTPQTSVTNQRLWLDLEQHTSELKRADNRVFVVRGPAFEGVGGAQASFTMIGASRVPVPTHYFQVAIIRDATGARLECHLVPNISVAPASGTDGSGERYKASLDQIQAMTGLALLPSAPAGVSGCR